MNDRKYAALTAIGPDRIGIVDGLSAGVEAAGGNIEESGVEALGGEFAVILLVSGGSDALSAVSSRLKQWEADYNLSLTLKSTVGARDAVGGLPYLIESVSMDRIGIVHRLTAILRKHNVNIEELDTETAPAPMTGTPMFRVRMRVIAPPSAKIPELKDAFDRLSRDQNLDVVIHSLA